MKHARTDESKLITAREAPPSEAEVLEKFSQELKSKGLAPATPSALSADGELHRYRVCGDGGQDSGWYRIYADDFPVAVYGSHRTGASEKWTYFKTNKLSKAVQASLKKRFANTVRKADKVHRKEQASKKIAIDDWNRAEKEVPRNHRYLNAKGIGSHGLRLLDGALLIPLRNAEGKLQARQRIYPSGKKGYRGPKQGCWHLLGGPIVHRVLIAEGYATAATVYEVTNTPTAMAGDSGNLKRVGLAIRAQYPLAEICFCADDDWEKVDKVGYNVGTTKAREAAEAVNGRVAIPVFKKPTPGASDFNDLYRLGGAKAVRKGIADAKTVPPTGGKEAFAMNAKQFLKLDIPKPTLLIVPWLRAGGLCMIHGWTGVGKTLLREALAAHLCAGQDFLCWKIPRPVSVLIVDGEMPSADVQVRLKDAMKSVGLKKRAPHRILANDQVLDGPIDLREPQWQELIEREAAGSEVIFLDNVATLAGDTADFNDAKAWTPIQRWMTKMRAKGHSVIWFHNDGKGGSQLGTATREIVLDVSIQLSELSPGKANGSSFKVKYTKPRWLYGKDKLPFKVIVETDPDGGKMDWTWQPLKAKADSSESYEATQKLTTKVLKLKKAGKSVREIEEELSISKSKIDRLIQKSKKSPKKKVEI